MLERLHFPVLALSQGSVIAHAAPETFSVATRRAVKNGYFDEMWLVDSDEKAYKVRGYELVSAPFWKRPKTPFGRGVLLHNFVLEEVPFAFDELRERIISCIGLHPELYDGAGDVLELVRTLRQSSTLSELFSVFGAPIRGA
jgi:hypothetical protein